MNIAITGASGLIGSRLTTLAAARGHTTVALSRTPQASALQGIDAVVHLAGEPVAQRWTAAAKLRIRESRELGTRQLVNILQGLSHRPQALICASAIGYYGSRGDEALEESAAPGRDFLAEVCVAWEREAMRASQVGVRVVRVRTGVVLDPHGGALARMLPIFRLAAGGPLGNGRQWMSWIHWRDLAELFLFAIENNLEGAFNAVAPHPVRNAQFTRSLARSVHRPAILPAPAFALRLAFGEMSGMLLASQRVVPAAAEAAGFRFQYPQLGPALEEILS